MEHLKAPLQAVYDLIDGKEAIEPTEETIQELFTNGLVDFAPTGFGLKTKKGKDLLSQPEETPFILIKDASCKGGFMKQVPNPYFKKP